MPGRPLSFKGSTLHLPEFEVIRTEGLKPESTSACGWSHCWQALLSDALEDLRAHSVFEGFLFLSLLEVIVNSGATKINNACCPVFLEPFDFPSEFKFHCLSPQKRETSEKQHQHQWALLLLNIFSNSAFYKRLGNSIWGILIVANIPLEILLKSWQKCTAVVFWLVSSCRKQLELFLRNNS